MVAATIAGPIAGALSYRWSIRTITITGVLIVSLGNVLCCFASTASMVTLYLGVLQGIGTCLAVTLVPVIINQYFTKYKTTGMGLACAGSTIGSFVLPPIVETAIEAYALHGAFLMMGGITLHGVLGAALMKPATWLKTKTPIANGISKDPPLAKPPQNHQKEAAYILLPDSVIPNKTNSSLQLNNTSDVNEKSKATKTVRFIIGDTISNGDSPHSKEECDSEGPLSDDTKILFNDSHVVSILAETVKKPKLEDSIESYFQGELKFIDEDDTLSNPPSKEVNGNYEESKQLLSNTNYSANSAISNTEKSDHIGTDVLKPRGNIMERTQRGIMRLLKMTWVILRNPIFLIITTNHAIFFLSYMTYLIVIVDYSLDLGISKQDSVFLVSIFSIGDLCGRLGSGWITDSGLIKRKNLMMANMVTLGAMFIGTSFAKTYPAIIAVSALAGLVVGINLILFFALVEEYVGLKEMAMAVGLMNFTVGAISFVTPLLTGFFRDFLGSYEYLFHFLGGSMIFCGLEWTLEPVYMKYKKKKGANIPK